MWRRILPAVSVTGLGAWSISSNAKCQQYESFAACGKTCIAPQSPETGRSYEETGYWGALANSMTHQVHSLKNCTSLRIKFLQNWENFPGKLEFQTREDGTEYNHHAIFARHPFPPRIKPGDTVSQVINTSKNVKGLSVFQIEGTEKILALIHYGAKGERDEVIETFGPYTRYNNVYNRYTQVHKGIGVYVGPPVVPLQIFNTVYGEELKGKNEKVEGENFAYFYDDTDDPNLFLETDLTDEVRIRVRAGFTSIYDYECKIVIEEI